MIAFERATWIDWDQHGRLIVARDGGLHVWAPTRDEPGALRLTADFNDQQFENIPAPAWAQQW